MHGLYGIKNYNLKMYLSIFNLQYFLRWFFRKNQPTLLPKLLLCVDWNVKQEAADAAAIVSCWPPLSPAHALELLDYAYPDRLVRRFAVSCLCSMR